ncbi:hypothetical protein ACFQ4P_04745 [Lacticaseibacillus mingshuiensis]|uniref:Uncharacterized protein n=1 Tax=Lacticaseibacillus mingshuiensis TaxID=2799574 RepID=A0ABW4CG86_9LACO
MALAHNGLSAHKKNGHFCPLDENGKSRSQLPKQNDLPVKLSIFVATEYKRFAMMSHGL